MAASPALARDYHPYVSVFGGASLLNDVKTVYAPDTRTDTYTLGSNTGYMFGGAVGIQWNKILRTEIELSHGSWSGNTLHFYRIGTKGGTDFPATGLISDTNLMSNIWLDIPTGRNFTPYVGGGLGIGWATANVSFIDPSIGFGAGNTGFAYQLGAGAKIGVSEHLQLDLGYRFRSLSGISFANIASIGSYNGASLNSHNFQIGLTYQF